jgi:hypothetical protein
MSRFEDFQDVLVTDSDGNPINETFFIDGCIIRFRNGYLNNWHNEEEREIYPAIECIDAHIEFWEEGKLNNHEGLAVISAGDNVLESWENGKKTQTEKYYSHELDKYCRLGRQAELNFARYLNTSNIPFIHLDQPAEDLFSTVFRNKKIKRPDYLVFINNKPLFIDVKATGCYKLYKTDLTGLDNLKKEYSIDVIFAITNINEPELNDFAFVTLDNMVNYSEVFEKHVSKKKWDKIPVPATLLSKEMVRDTIGNDELLKICQDEKDAYWENKNYYYNLLREYLGTQKYKCK